MNVQYNVCLYRRQVVTVLFVVFKGELVHFNLSLISLFLPPQNRV